VRRILLLLALLGVLGPLAVASPLCTDGGTLQSYIDNYKTLATACQIGDKLFYGFVFTKVGGFGPNAPQINVQTLPGDGLSNIGIDFNSGGWAVAHGNRIDETITFDVRTVSGSALIKDATLTMTGSLPTNKSGSATITETLSPTEPGSPLITSLATTLSSHIDFTSGRQAQFQVSDHIVVVGGTGFGDVVHLSVVENDFSELVPEPLTALPVGLGLLLLAGVRRRSRGRDTGGMGK
jgi:hypothetical protein